MSEYHDKRGNPVTLYVLCSEDPTWARNRIEELIGEVSKLFFSARPLIDFAKAQSKCTEPDIASDAKLALNDWDDLRGSTAAPKASDWDDQEMMFDGEF